MDKFSLFLLSVILVPCLSGTAVSGCAALADGLPKAPPEERPLIMLAMGYGRCRKAVPILLESWERLQGLKFRMALPEEERALRVPTLEALSAVGVPAALEPLRRGMIDDDPQVVAAAARGLGRLKDEHSAGAIAKLLDSPDERVRGAAYEALGSIGGPSARSAVEGRRSAPAACALARMGEEEGALLLDGFLEESAVLTEDGVLAAGCLAGLGEKRGMEYLLRALDDAALRLRAIEALGRSGSKKALGPLAGLLGSPEAPVRAAAALALGLLGRRGAAGPLQKAAQDPDVRTALARLGEYPR